MNKTVQDLMDAIEARCYGTGVTFRYEEVKKNNGIIKHGIIVDNGTCTDGTKTLAPVIYVNHILEMMEKGELDSEEAAEEFEEVYRQAVMHAKIQSGGGTEIPE